MPAENLNPTPPEQPEDDWQQLAHEAEHWDLKHPGVAALYENHVVPQLHSKGLGHLAISTEDKAGGRFLHKHGNIEPQEVDHVIGYLRQNGETVADKAGDRTAMYLQFMADTVNDGVLTGDPESVSRQIEAHVIKTEDVPESYFALQQRIAREHGHGDTEITLGEKLHQIEAIQADQRGSLDRWVEYLGGDDGSYPDWFKRYTWDSVLKLGTYDKEKAAFNRRTTSTVAPYPELNREALAYVFDTVNNFHVLNEAIDDAKLKHILKGGNFGHLYARAITKVTPDNPELRNQTKGSWTQYHQTTDPRTARRLSHSLQAHGTGWCTAGESTAQNQLHDGDFYVYYTRDEDNKDTIPRIAIRMKNDEVAEVRGVLPSQELEPILADIASEKLQGLPGGDTYIKRAADMRRLTAIDDLLSSNPDAGLTRDDIKFLYELSGTIQGFGYDTDPRIAEIRAKRGNRDIELLKVMTVEHLRESFDASYSAYSTVASELQSRLGKRSLFRRNHEQSAQASVLLRGEVEELFNEQLTEWQQRGVLDYIVERMVSHGEVHQLIARPNVSVPVKQLYNLAHRFAQGQAGFNGAYINHPLYNKYNTEQEAASLCGYDASKGPVVFSLISNKLSSELGHKSYDVQRQKLMSMQTHAPHLGLKVPSVLDALTFWHTLRAKGDKLCDDTTPDKTSIRHIDMHPKSVGRGSSVPLSYVYISGEPRLENSSIENMVTLARLAVG